MKRALAREQLVKDHAQAEDVGTPVHAMGLGAGLFGAHVPWRTGDCRTLAKILFLQREPEIDHVWLARPVQQDVRRFDVAMNKTPKMGVM